MSEHDSPAERPADMWGDAPSAIAGAPLAPELQALAADYHRPPDAVPRDAMWTRIAAARAAAASDTAASDTAAIDTDVVVLPLRAATDRRSSVAARHAARRPWIRPLLAAAATLLVGVAIGRGVTRDPQRPAGVAAPAPIAAAPSTPALSDPAPPVAPSVAPSVAVAPRPVAAPTVAAVAPRSLPAPAMSSGEPAGSSAEPSAASVANDAARLSTVQVAAAQHFGQAEALLVAFRAEPPRDGTAPALQASARELLTTTRLLLDSPAAADPRLGPLLGDLETVLVQIVQFPSGSGAGERQILARALDRTDLMTHLRAAVPAGLAAPHRSGE